MSPYLNKRAISSILLIVIFPIVTLRLLGFLQWMEWYSYDLLFHWSPTELKDDRIVLVVWDEKDLQISAEATMNDQTLGFVLEEINKQQPRLIGLDIYRDIPVPSRLLSDEEDEEAYNRLQEIFRSTPNLIGIEKVIEPIVNPNPVLKKEGQTYSSDLITDSDNVLRRSFSEISEDYAYIGTALGYFYLNHVGWNYSRLNQNSILIFKDEQKIVLQDLKIFDGGYINNRVGRDFLVNWRRGSSLFTQYSVEDIKKGKVPSDAFKDKIVLIGNISSSSSDIHHFPTDKWDNIQSWTYGIEVVAQITSSIISAALDERPLLRVAPWGLGYILLALGIIFVTFITSKFANVSVGKLYLISGLSSLIFTVLLLVGSLIAFQTIGWWIPIIPSVLGVWASFLVLNYERQINKEKVNLFRLGLVTGHFGHEAANCASSIKCDTITIESRIQDIQYLVQNLYDGLLEEYQEYTKDDYYPPDSSFIETERGEQLHELTQKIHQAQTIIPDIFQQIKTIGKYVTKTKDYIEVKRGKKKIEPEITRINDYVELLVRDITADLQEECKTQIFVNQVYDPTLRQSKLDRKSLEIVLKVLLENAFDALLSKLLTTSDFTPSIIVQTKKRRNWIEITVEDNGIGIPKSLRNEIFKEGFSGKSAAQGQGIGLSLAKDLLALEQGKIRVESEVGKGSKFIVLLPKK